MLYKNRESVNFDIDSCHDIVQCICVGALVHQYHNDRGTKTKYPKKFIPADRVSFLRGCRPETSLFFVLALL